jgi:hypothetical protein
MKSKRSKSLQNKVIKRALAVVFSMKNKSNKNMQQPQQGKNITQNKQSHKHIEIESLMTVMPI